MRNKSTDHNPLSMKENVDTVGDMGSCTVLTQSGNETVSEEINFSNRRVNTDFARGVEDASRARKILLASFAS